MALKRPFAGFLISVVLLAVAACGSNPEQPVRAFAEGRLDIRTQEDSTKDFSGFEVFLAGQESGDVDTLGLAVTDRDGRFTMDVIAKKEGVYPLIISRAGARLAVEEFVLVDGDSSTITGTFPLNGRQLRIVSEENAAWTAYRNAKYQHNERLLAQLQNQDAGVDNMRRTVLQTSTILWSIRNSYPSAMAADLASVESIVMMEGWDDSLVVKRLAELSPDNDNIVDAVRAARRSTARLFGQDSSLALVNSYVDRLESDEQRAALQAEIVVAHTDSTETQAALDAALELRRLYPDTPWAGWASRATYELENLLPGMMAPAFAVTTVDGERVSTQSLKGNFVILEFFEPTSDVFLKELAERNAVFSALNQNVFTTLSVSLEPDSTINQALFDDVKHPGLFAFEPDGREADIAKQFNVQIIPTRVLIDPDGRIVEKYPGSAMLSLEDDLVAIIDRLKRAEAAFD